MPDRAYVTVEEFERMKAERDAAIARVEKAREEGVEATFLRIRNSLGLAYEKMVRAVVDPVLLDEEWSYPGIKEESNFEEDDEELAR